MMKTWVVILSLVLSALLIGSAGRAIDNIRESRIAETSREMVTNGDWMVPHFNGDIRLQKPPLTYWTTAISYKLFGVSELSTRLPSMLFAVMLLALIFTWIRQQTSTETAVNVVLVLATSLISLRHFRSGEADTTLIFFISAACYAGFNLLHRAENEQRKWAALAMLTMGLGFLSKGPAGIAIPLFTLLAYAYLNQQVPVLKRLLSLPGLGLFLLAAGSWYAWVFLTMPDAAQHFFGRQLDETFVSGTHQQPVYWYLVHITEFFLPWGLLLIPMGIWYYLNRPLSRMVLFAWVWFAVVFVLLTFTVNKQMQYALLFAPAVAILLGNYLSVASGKFHKLNSVLFWLLCAGVAGMVVFAFKKHAFNVNPVPYWIALLLIPLALKNILKLKQPASAMLVAATLSVFGYLFSEQYLSKDMEKNDIQQLTQQILTYEPIFQNTPGHGAFSFYAQRPIKTMGQKSLAEYMQTHDSVWYLSKDKPDIQQYGVQEEKTVGHWTLWKISK